MPAPQRAKSNMGMTARVCDNHRELTNSYRSGMPITWTYDAPGLAYISLTSESSRGFVKTSVDLSDLAEDQGVESLHSIVLDFDAERRLVGIEIPGNAETVLPRDLLAERGFDENRYRRSI